MCFFLGLNRGTEIFDTTAYEGDVPLINLDEYRGIKLGEQLRKGGVLATHVSSSKYNEIYHSYMLNKTEVIVGSIDSIITAVKYTGTSKDISDLINTEYPRLIEPNMLYSTTLNIDGTKGFIKEWYVDGERDIKKVIYFINKIPYEVIFINDAFYEVRKVV